MANTRKRKQKQTLKEFRAWLQGVEELQPENWSPNSDQWKLIRDKIDGIVVEKQIVEKIINNSVTTSPQPALRALPAAPAVGVPAGMVPPPPASGVPPADVQMTPAARQMLNPSASEKAKTPDMDTSDGNVSSPFA